MTQSSFRLFHDALRHQTERQLSTLAASATDVAIPPAILEVGLLLKEILSTYYSSLLAPMTSSPVTSSGEKAPSPLTPDRGAADMELVLGTLVEPTVRAVFATGALLPPATSGAFVINCLHHLEVRGGKRG